MERKIYISAYDKTAIIGADLVAFLKKEGVIRKFITNIQNADWGHTTKKVFKIRGIDTAFTWLDTPEGHDYWDDIDEKYNATKK